MNPKQIGGPKIRTGLLSEYLHKEQFMDKASIAIYISVTSAFFALVTLIITIWKFTIEKQKFKLEIQKLNKDLR